MPAPLESDTTDVVRLVQFRVVRTDLEDASFGVASAPGSCVCSRVASMRKNNTDITFRVIAPILGGSPQSERGWKQTHQPVILSFDTVCSIATSHFHEIDTYIAGTSRSRLFKVVAAFLLVDHYPRVACNTNIKIS